MSKWAVELSNNTAAHGASHKRVGTKNGPSAKFSDVQGVYRSSRYPHSQLLGCQERKFGKVEGSAFDAAKAKALTMSIDMVAKTASDSKLSADLWPLHARERRWSGTGARAGRT